MLHRTRRAVLGASILASITLTVWVGVSVGRFVSDGWWLAVLIALPPRSARTSRGSIVHNLPGGIRLRESAGSIELLGEARDDALEQLVTVAQQRFGTKRVTLLGTRGAQKRLAQLAEERGLEIAEERQR